MHLLQQVPRARRRDTRSAAMKRAGFPVREAMLQEVLSVFQPPAFVVMATVRKLLKALLVGRGRRRRRRRRLGGRVAPRRSARSTYEDIQEHFKYGSIGSEPGVSLLRRRRRPAALLGVQGAAVGLQRQAAESGYATRSASSPSRARICRSASRRRRRLGVDHVGLNCAVCHTGTVREPPTAAPRIVLGMPAQQLDLQALRPVRARVHARQPADRRRGARAACRSSGGPSLFERALLRVGLIDRLKLHDARTCATASRRSGRARAALGTRPRGHVQSVQGGPVQLGPRTGCRRRADWRRPTIPSLWNQEPREGHAPALGRRQRLGGRAQPERGARRRRDAGHRRSRGPEARPRLDLDAAAAGLPVSDQPDAGRARRAALSAALRRTATPTTGSATA